ncbi:hypothetical protein GGI12_000465 [Dipsacomyces acuminosporus]|nr:hypothetical protein GGI12_000465 [Dipsacomyces acuminosporus]
MARIKDNRDLIVIGVCAGLLFFNLVILAYAFFNRRYLPLKSKNLPIMYLGFVAMLCWSIGSVYGYHSSYLNKNGVICAATFGVARMSLGSFLFIGLFQFRVYQYIVIFLWRKRAKGRYLWCPVLYLVTISFAYALAAFLLPPKWGFSYNVKNQTCHAQSPIFIFGLCVLVVQFAISVALTVKARTINACFNEYVEIIVTISLTALSGVVTILVHWYPASPDQKYPLRIVETLAVLVFSQVYFVLILGPPIYHSLVDREQYLCYFMRRLMDYRLVREYDLASLYCSSTRGSVASQATLVGTYDPRKPPEVSYIPHA